MMDTLEFLIIYTLGLFAGIGLVAAIGIGLVYLAAFIGDFFDALFGRFK